jgi:hypothetical protein
MKISDRKLLKSFRGIRCEWCFWRKAIHAAHLFHNGMGGKKQLDVRVNLVGLCAHDHFQHHCGARPTLADLLKIVARREELSVDTIVERIRLLQRLPKQSERPAWA